jgi:hypothetical protein
LFDDEGPGRLRRHAGRQRFAILHQPDANRKEDVVKERARTQPPVLATVRVRMYQVGFGDCFLLSFEYAARPSRLATS